MQILHDARILRIIRIFMLSVQMLRIMRNGSFQLFSQVESAKGQENLGKRMRLI